MVNFVSNLKYDLDKTFRDLGHDIYNLKVTTLVKENTLYRISGTCEVLFTDMFGSPKILDFTAKYDPIKREINEFEITSRVRL